MTDRELEKLIAQITDLKLHCDDLTILVKSVYQHGCENVYGKPWFEIRDEIVGKNHD